MNRAVPAKPIRLSRSLSCLRQVDALCGEIRSLLQAAGFDKICFSVELVARECLNNALLHGNGGNTGKRAFLRLRSRAERICIQVADQGSGFDWKQIRRPPNGRKLDGRGLFLVAAYAQRVRFNRTGNQITLWVEQQPGKARKLLCQSTP